MESTRITPATAASSNSHEIPLTSTGMSNGRFRLEAPASSPQISDLRPWRGQQEASQASVAPRNAATLIANANANANVDTHSSRRLSARTDSTISAASFRSTVTHFPVEPDLDPDNLAAPPARRTQLLESYLAATQRPLDTERALAAIKLRCAAEVFCEKNEWARFAPRLSKKGAQRRRFEELVTVAADELIRDVAANPKFYSRTLLTDLAQHHLLAAFNIDVPLYREGIREAAKYEGLHSVAGRVVSTLAAGASAGLSALPGTEHALKAAQKAVKVLAHELPPNIVNPALTGGLRSVTDVKEAFKRVGGQPVVSPQIEGSPDMGKIVVSLKAKRRALTSAIERFRTAAQTEAGAHAATGALVDAFLALHETADREYRRRIGLNRTQTYSKGWGMAVNGVASAGAVVTATVPVAGQIAGPVILASTIPLQWGAGYLDERRNKHRYNLRANTKWGDFLTREAAHVHFKDLTVDHISEAKLRKAFVTQPEVQIAAVREVYEDALGDWVREHAQLEHKIGVMQASGTTPARALTPHRTKLAELTERIETTKQQVADFESFDPVRWAAIATDSLIGRCLDDLNQLEKANRHARLRKPGESAQIVQRYVQAFHAGVSTGTTLPIMDAITTIDSTHTFDANGHQTGLRTPDEAGALTAGIGGGAVFTAATGEVRMTKADNKKLLSEPLVSPLRAGLHEARWTFRAGDRTVDLRGTAGYRKYANTTWDELRLLGRAVGHGLISGPVGLANLARAKWWPRGELRLAKRELRDALHALDQAGLEKVPPPAGGRAATISAMKDELYDYAAVRRHLGVA